MIGLNRPIVEDELYTVLDSMKSAENTERLSILWEHEKKRRKPSLLRAMLNLYGYKVVTIGFIFTICDTLSRYVNLHVTIFQINYIYTANHIIALLISVYYRRQFHSDACAIKLL